MPYPWGDFFYYTRTVKGKAYPIHCRKRSVGGAPGGPEQLVLDVNAVGRGKAFCDVQAVVPSPDHTLVAYCVDFSGYETYQVVILDMATGRATGEVLEGCFGDVSWGRTSKELFYTTMDAEHRPDKAWRHVLGQPQAQDECLHEEPDALFEVDVEVRRLPPPRPRPPPPSCPMLSSPRCGLRPKRFRARGGFCSSMRRPCAARRRDSSTSTRRAPASPSSSLSARTRTTDTASVPDASRPTLANWMPVPGPLTIAEGGAPQVEHWGEHFFIITNADKCVNSKLVKTPISKPGRVNWVDVLPYQSRRPPPRAYAAQVTTPLTRSARCPHAARPPSWTTLFASRGTLSSTGAQMATKC